VKRSGGEKAAVSVVWRADDDDFEPAKADFRYGLETVRSWVVSDNVFVSKDPALNIGQIPPAPFQIEEAFSCAPVEPRLGTRVFRFCSSVDRSRRTHF
jgi:hypothetical protein